MGHYLAIDIGGTYIKYALINNEEQLIHHGSVPTNAHIPGKISEQVNDIALQHHASANLKGIGISTAGIVDRQKGEIMYAGPTIPNYKGTNFKQVLKSIELPIHVENDVNAALLGELWKGAAVARDGVFCITLGTGIGGAYFNAGLIDGSHSQANSVGYLLYDQHTKTNYEQRASTSALNSRIKKELPEEMTPRELFECARNNNPLCYQLLNNWTRDVAAGLAQIILMIDPQLILIGGGISQQGEYLLNLIKGHIPTFLPDDFLETEIKMAKLHNDAALYGAVYPLIKHREKSN